MAKKTRQVRQQQATQRAIRQAVNNMQSVAIAPAAVSTAPRPAGTKVAPIDPAEEYKFVRSDLRRILMLAVAFTAIMVALSFVLPSIIR
ncbi:MAG TPA: hypothetical protein VFK30_07775 [Anaerolineae bacterium]|nr:hypothetical protein [Anaerolineae bacterium]